MNQVYRDIIHHGRGRRRAGSSGPWYRQWLAPQLALLGLGMCACGSGFGSASHSLPLPSAAIVHVKLPSEFLYLPGETMRFEVRVRGVLIGRAALAVGEPGLLQGRSTVIVASEVRSAGVGKVVKEMADDTKTWLDLAKGRVLAQHEEIRFGKRDMVTDTRFGANEVWVEFERRKQNPDPTQAAAITQPAIITRPAPSWITLPPYIPPARSGTARVPIARPARSGTARVPTSAPARSDTARVPTSAPARSGTARVPTRPAKPPRTRSWRIRIRRNAAAARQAAKLKRRPHLRYVLPSNEYGMDLHAVLGALRAWRREVGQHLYFYALSERFIWHNQLDFTGTEMIRTPTGLYSALRFEGVATRMTNKLLPDPRRVPRSYTIWLSYDHKRVPLRVVADTKYGDISIDLVDYKPPA